MKSRGFTLIELVVALVILALMAPLLASGLRLGLRSWDGVEARLRARQDLQLAGLFLARALEQARPGAFSGGPRALEFLAPAPAPMGRGLHAHTLLFADGRLALKFGTGALFSAEHSAVLAERVADARFDYWRAPTRKEPGAWLARWERGDPPALVRLRLRLADGVDAVHEVVVATRVGSSQPENEND